MFKHTWTCTCVCKLYFHFHRILNFVNIKIFVLKCTVLNLTVYSQWLNFCIHLTSDRKYKQWNGNAPCLRPVEDNFIVMSITVECSWLLLNASKYVANKIDLFSISCSSSFATSFAFHRQFSWSGAALVSNMNELQRGSQMYDTVKRLAHPSFSSC